MVPSESGLTPYAIKEGVEQQVAQQIEAIFETTQGAPIYTNQYLHKNFGLLLSGNTEAVCPVLEGV